MSEYLVVALFSFFEVILGYWALISFREKDYLAAFFGVFLFLVCLIGLGFLLNRLMIDDAVILQVDATVIAGLLILLSLTSVWNKNQNTVLTTKIIRNTGLYWTPRQIFFIVIPFSLSAIATLINFLEPNFMRYLSVSMCVVGFLFIMILGWLFSSKDKPVKNPKYTDEKLDDDGKLGK